MFSSRSGGFEVSAPSKLKNMSEKERPSTFASLRIPQYRLFWLGYLLSNIGTWMGWVAQDWLVFSQLSSHSAAAMGIITAFQIAPMVLLAPWTGRLSDRYPERLVLLATTTVMLGTSTLLAIAVLTGWVSLYWLWGLSLIQGLAVAVEGPARQSLVTDLVPVHLLTNAVGLNSLSFNAARLLGSAGAALVVSRWGVGPAITLNALSFVLLLGSVCRLRVAPRQKFAARSGLGGLRQAWAQVRCNRQLALALLVACALSIFTFNLALINALMVQREFGQTVAEFGGLGAAMAVGTIAAALFTTRQSHPRLQVSLTAAAGFAVCAAIAATAPSQAVYTVCVALMGACAISAILLANSSVRIMADGPQRGQLMALYLACTQGCYLLGSLGLGWVGDWLGPRWLLALASFTLLGVCGWVYHVARGGFAGSATVRLLA